VTDPLIECRDLSAGYGKLAAIRNIDLQVHSGEIVALIGRNGTGKSSTLHAVMGVVGIAAGDVRLHGRSVRGLAPEQMARLGVALVPEGRHVYASLTVAEELSFRPTSRLARASSGIVGAVTAARPIPTQLASGWCEPSRSRIASTPI